MGKKTSTSTQAVSIPPEVLARYNAVNARAEKAANTPYQYYGGEFVAPLTSTQRSGMANINNAATMAQPYYASATNYLQNAQAATQPYFGAAGDAYGAGLAQGQGYLGEATNFARAGGYNVDPSKLDANAIQQYISPYLSNVLQGVAGLQNQNNQFAMSSQIGNAVRSGAFGGDRGGVTAANLAQQQRLADANIYSGILNTAYNNALNTAANQQALYLGANQANRTAAQQTADRLAALGQQGFNQYTTTGQNVQGLGKDIYNVGAATSKGMADLGTGAQNAAIQGGQAQMEAGGIEQATKQAEDTAYYNQFKEAQSLPYQQATFLANIAEGTGALSGSTTTTQQPGGFFSDERMKENIQPVGKTYDGQHIYRYNYKGDPTTHIGLIAQEVEHHHPEAVGLAGGMKTVDYDKATDHSAHIAEPHKGLGGFLSKNGPGIALFAASPYLWSQIRPDQNKDDGESMGGGVMPQQAGQGFASGGLAGHAARMAALYDQLYSAGSGHGIAGMQGIPTEAPVARELITAAGLAGKGGNDVADAVNTVDAIGRLGNKIGVWHGYGERAPEPRYPMDEKPAYADGGMAVDPIEQKRQEEAAGLAKAALEASKPTPPAGLGAAAPESAPVQSTPINLEKNKIEVPKKDMKFGTPSGAAPHLSIANAPTKPTNHGSATIDDLSKLVQMGTSMAGAMAHGGRIHRDLGGGMPYSGGQSIVPDSTPQQHQLMTAQGTAGGGGGGGLGAVGKIAGLASNFIPGGGIVKKGLGMIGKIFSDERMKENIRPIGELFDGQKVYSYNLKGDHRTQIGLLAQEVEHHNPHAVGHADGMKTVDYHDATQHAAHRGHFAEGGMPDGVTSILEQLRQRIDPRFKISDLEREQDEELHHDLYPNKPSDGHFSDFNQPSDDTQTMQPKKPDMEFGQPPQTPKQPGLIGTPIDNSPLPTGIMDIARLIHRGEGTTQNPKSSAYGPYQMIDSTFIGQFRKHYPDRARGMSDRDILRVKYSPEGYQVSEYLGPRMIAENAKIVAHGGFTPDAGNVYLANFVGPQTAVKLLRTNPNDPLVAHVGQDAVDANPTMQKNPTVGGFINAVRGYMRKQAVALGREHHASGGLAGRHGYAFDGGVPFFADPDFMNEMDREKRPDFVPNQASAPIDQNANPVEVKDIKLPSAPPSLLNAAPTTETPPVSGLNTPAPLGGRSLVTDTPTPPAKKAGLAQRVFGYDPAHPYDRNTDQSFFHRLGHGETDAVLSALQGLAAMGTMPTRSLGVALAAGLGAGAKGYQEQREFGRQLRETAAVEESAKAAREHAAADITAAAVNISSIPAKIAGWKGFLNRGGELGKIAEDTIKKLEAIYQTGKSALDTVQGNAGAAAASTPVAGLNAAAPAPAQVEGTAPAAGLNPQPKTDAKGQMPPPGSLADLVDRSNFASLTGLSMPGLAAQLEMAKSGILPDLETGGVKYDPTYSSAKIARDIPVQTASETTSANTELGKDTWKTIKANFRLLVPYQETFSNLWKTFNDPIYDEKNPRHIVPTTGLLNSLAQAYAKLKNWDQKTMEAHFGKQPTANSILAAAAAEGIPVTPDMGIAGIKTVIKNKLREIAIADVSQRAASDWLKANKGVYGPGMQDYVNQVIAATPGLFK